MKKQKRTKLAASIINVIITALLLFGLLVSTIGSIGFGICFVKKKRKLFYIGTFALLTMASIYHGIFNMLVQSDYKFLGFVLPALTYVPILIQQYFYYKRKNEN